MATKYTVQDGDSIASIAREHGYLWRSIWDHSDNADLKRLRKDPNVLLAGDVVTLPDPVGKEETRPTGKRHTFVRKGEPTKLRVKLTRFGKPRANVAYKLVVDGTEIKGKTDGSGWVDQYIPGNSKQARLVIGDEEHMLKIGHLDPADSVSGVQARLRNLGYDCGGEDGEVGELTARALVAFQRANSLSPTGKVDAPTIDKLKQAHG